MSAIPGLPPLPDNELVRDAREVCAVLQEAGFEACFVGGCVRDWLLGLEPHDIDVATSARPEQVAALFEKTREVGAHFGVVLVHFSFAVIEVATFRRDGEYIDFRRPVEVHYGTMEEDAKRRDFTINAMFYDPIGGKLKDFYSGTLDLRRRILRSVGHARDRFEEDALRLMRAVRLAIRFDLEIELHTRKAIVAKAPNLQKISMERIGEELVRILTGPNAGRAMHLMSDLGIWAQIVPEVEALKGCEQGADKHPEGDVFVHTALALDKLPPDPPPELALSVLLHDIAKPRTQKREEGRIRFLGHQKVGAEMAEEICRRLKLSAAVAEEVADLVDHHMQFMDVWKMKESKLKRFLGKANFPKHLELHKCDSLASHGDLDAYNFCVDRRRELAVEHGEEMKPKPLATGEDLITLGLKPGPRFRELLDALHDEQLEGRVRTREEAMEYLRRRSGEGAEQTSEQE